MQISIQVLNNLVSKSSPEGEDVCNEILKPIYQRLFLRASIAQPFSQEPVNFGLKLVVLKFSQYQPYLDLKFIAE